MLPRAPLVVALTLAFAVTGVAAFGQQVPTERGYAIGFGGLGASEINTQFYGGSVGFNLTPTIQITGDISRAQDVLTPFTKEDLNLLDSAVSAETGFPFSSSVKMTTNFYVAGVRVRLPGNSSVRPYISGGGGVAHMSPVPKFVVGGLDMTTLAMQQELVATTFREETRPMATVGGGIAVVLARHFTVDLGYKYSATFINTDYLQDYETSPHSHSRIDTHKVFAGAGIVF